ncbi:MAG: KpsF/GutQ family sugar-phosphate isomerase [Chitinophagales bacterium]|nr:KpsF/GutQ family sugar-phosphate isomerase [Chitinophagales bacterium]
MNISDPAIIKLASATLEIEAKSLLQLKKRINKDFPKAIKSILTCKGRVVITGIGKSAIIAQKIVATLNSTGTASIFMHAADAIHGDLGMVTTQDVVIMISKSGESSEIKVLVPLIKNNGNILIAMAGNIKSFLAAHADFVIDTTVTKEACPNNLAPTSSTTAQLAMGDAIAVCLLKMRGFSQQDFAKFHPGGALGKKLYLKVSDLLVQHSKPQVNENDLVQKVILTITSNRLGATAVLNNKNEMVGIITDGDLRRMMNEYTEYQTLKAKDIMSRNPKTISKDELAVNALELMRKNKITQVMVMDKKKYTGIVHVHDLLREGLV